MNKVLSSLSGDSAGYLPGNVPPAADVSGNVLTNINEVVQYELIARLQQIQALQAIIRFDALPLVNTSRPVVAQIFHFIFDSIFQHPPAGTKLFIYIKCEKERTEVMDLSLPVGFQPYEISVFTNIIANENWQQQQQAAITGIKQGIESIKGTFENFAIDKTGRLYKLVLPGKLI
jgi:hypothetical protein